MHWIVIWGLAFTMNTKSYDSSIRVTENTHHKCFATLPEAQKYMAEHQSSTGEQTLLLNLDWHPGLDESLDIAEKRERETAHNKNSNYGSKYR